jgi:hypothetical protein
MVRAAHINLSAQRVSVDYDPEQTSAHDLLETISLYDPAGNATPM